MFLQVAHVVAMVVVGGSGGGLTSGGEALEADLVVVAPLVRLLLVETQQPEVGGARHVQHVCRRSSIHRLALGLHGQCALTNIQAQLCHRTMASSPVTAQ